MSKAGGDFLPRVFRVGYNVHESFATFGEIRDSEGGRGEKEKERGREKTRYPDQPVREKSRSFIRIRKFLSDISSFLRDGTGRHMVWGNIGYAVAAVAVALVYGCFFIMVISLIS